MRFCFFNLVFVIMLCSPAAIWAQATGRVAKATTTRLPATTPFAFSSKPELPNGAREQQATPLPPQLINQGPPTPPLDGSALNTVVAHQPIAPSLTLADLETMALTNNPSVARSAALVQAARGAHLQVGLAPNPTVGYEGQQIGSRGLAEQDGVFVSQEIVRGGKLKLNRQIAAQDWARAEQELVAQQQRVLTDVHVGFYQVLIAQKQEALTSELLQVAQEALGVAENLQLGKEVGRADVVQAQLESENADILAQNARNRLTSSWQSLAAVLGNPHLPQQQLSGDLEESKQPYQWETSLSRLLASSPEITAANANVERSRWAVQRALVEKTPNVFVQGLVNVRDNGIGGRSDGSLTVGVPLPIWNRNQGGVIQAQSEAAAAEKALEQVELSLRNRLAPVFERYANASNQVTKYRSKILPAAQEALDLTRKMYRTGETGYVSLLTAQRTYSQTNLNYLESLRGLKTSESEIEGLLLSGSLDVR